MDVLSRPAPHILTMLFDGRHIPDEDNSIDVLMLVDVLHHTDDPGILLSEARRVTRRAVVLKDHTREARD
jgi:ubiquinone/menaquinone biosynthesis C-methylase UbiE